MTPSLVTPNFRASNPPAEEFDPTDCGRTLFSIRRIKDACRQSLKMIERLPLHGPDESVRPIEKYLAEVLREEAAKLDPK